MTKQTHSDYIRWMQANYQYEKNKPKAQRLQSACNEPELLYNQSRRKIDNLSCLYG